MNKFNNHNEEKKNETTLESLIASLIIKSTQLVVEEPTELPENSQLTSHFGGEPYFEKNEEWPKSNSGDNLEFIFQIYNNGYSGFPDNIKLIQFYYDFDLYPWDTKDDGWLVKIYNTIDTDNIKSIPKPSELKKTEYCEISFKQIDSLPDWESLESVPFDVSLLLNEDDDGEKYYEIYEELIGDSEMKSQIGGYPQFVQDDETPDTVEGEPMEVLFQLVSEENPDIIWGDFGVALVFYDEKTNQIEFKFQTH